MKIRVCFYAYVRDIIFFHICHDFMALKSVLVLNHFHTSRAHHVFKFSFFFFCFEILNLCKKKNNNFLTFLFLCVSVAEFDIIRFKFCSRREGMLGSSTVCHVM